MSETGRESSPEYPDWAQPDAAVAYSRVVHEFVSETLAGGADADNVMMQAESMLGAWLIARGLAEPGYGAMRWAERRLRGQLANTERRLREVKSELKAADADRARLRQAETRLISALTEIAQHRTARGRLHRCTGRCARALIARAQAAVAQAQRAPGK